MNNPKLIQTLALLVIFISSNFNAQDKGWHLGLVGGSGVVTRRPDEFILPDKFRGIGGGISAKYAFTKNFGVSVNLLSERKVSRYET